MESNETELTVKITVDISDVDKAIEKVKELQRLSEKVGNIALKEKANS